mgnify:CR=1 FL=1
MLSNFTTYRKITAEDFCIAKRFRVNFYHIPNSVRSVLNSAANSPLERRFLGLPSPKAGSCRHQGKTWRFCGFPKGTLRKVASLALLTRSPQTQIICVCSSHFATHNGCPLCYEVPRSSLHKGAKKAAKSPLIRGK